MQPMGGYPAQQPQEIVYLNESGIMVTSLRVVGNGVTYALSHVTSVRIESKMRSTTLLYLGIMLLGIGLLGVIVGITGDSLGVGGGCGGTFILFGAIMVLCHFYVLHDEHWIRIGIGSGEREIVCYRDWASACRTSEIITQALMRRG